MAPDELERGLQLHQQWIEGLREAHRLHEQEMEVIRDNQRVQGELLNRAGRTLADTTEVVKKLTENMVVLQAGIEAVLNRVDALTKSLEAGNGRRRRK